MSNKAAPSLAKEKSPFNSSEPAPAGMGSGIIGNTSSGGNEIQFNSRQSMGDGGSVSSLNIT